MSNFDDFLNSAKSQVIALAKTLGKDCVGAAISDGHKFLEDSKADLEHWTSQLIHGEINQDDFSFLIQAKKDLAEMKALEHAGLSLVKIEKFRIALLDTLVKTAIKFIP